jgi:hypothetical protein
MAQAAQGLEPFLVHLSISPGAVRSRGDRREPTRPSHRRNTPWPTDRGRDLVQILDRLYRRGGGTGQDPQCLGGGDPRPLARPAAPVPHADPVRHRVSEVVPEPFCGKAADGCNMRPKRAIVEFVRIYCLRALSACGTLPAPRLAIVPRPSPRAWRRERRPSCGTSGRDGSETLA